MPCRTGGSILANLEFRECSFGESEEKKAVIEVEGCDSAPADSTLLLHHISFKENRLVEAAGVWVHSKSCLGLEMHNVEFSDNRCSSSGCGAILSSDNRIEDFTARRNRLTEEHDRQPSVLNAPAGSRTVANGITAARNDLSAMRVVEGSLSVTNSTCSRNSVGVFDDEEPFGSCIHLVQSTAAIHNSRFERNEGYWGGSVSVQSSNVSLVDSVFRNGRAEKGGVFFAERGSNVSIERCRFTENEASEQGGVGFIVSSSVSLINTSVSNNSAVRAGGVFRLIDSKLSIEACHLQDGNAPYGGFIYMRRTSANVSDSEFARGFANYGGCINSDEGSQLVSQNVIFRSSSASRSGGVVSAWENSSLSFINATFTSNSAGGIGHCISVDMSYVYTKQSLVVNNTGVGPGSFLHALNHSSAEITGTTFLHNSALLAGVVHLGESSMRVYESLFSGNTAAHGGGSFYLDRDSTLFIRLCRFDNGTAGAAGGFIASIGSEIRISSSSFTNGSAVHGGCFTLSTGTSMILENSTVAFCRAQSDGGAVFADTSTVVARNISVANSTSDRGTGGVACSQMCRIAAFDSSFEANSGVYGTAMSVTEESVATLTRCRFSGNIAQHSGASLHVDDSNASLSDCIFTNESAAIRGGAIYAEDSSTIHVQNSSFLGNQAKTSGGAIVVISESELIGDALIFDENSAREGDGGNIFSENSHRLQILNSQFSRGIATNAGGILLRNVEAGGVFVNCSFENNSVRSLGGACGVVNSTARFENCSMLRNRAGQIGGSLTAVDSTIDIYNSHFSGNNGTDSGGSIGAGGNSEIRGYNVSMVESSSQFGGAVWLHDSVIQLENAHFSKCHAIESGGVRDQSSAGEKASAN